MSVFKSHNYSLTKFSSFLNPKPNTKIKIKGDLKNLKENIFNEIQYSHTFVNEDIDDELISLDNENITINKMKNFDEIINFDILKKN